MSKPTPFKAGDLVQLTRHLQTLDEDLSLLGEVGEVVDSNLSYYCLLLKNGRRVWWQKDAVVSIHKERRDFKAGDPVFLLEYKTPRIKVMSPKKKELIGTYATFKKYFSESVQWAVCEIFSGEIPWHVSGLTHKPQEGDIVKLEPYGSPGYREEFVGQIGTVELLTTAYKTAVKVIGQKDEVEWPDNALRVLTRKNANVQSDPMKSNFRPGSYVRLNTHDSNVISRHVGQCGTLQRRVSYQRRQKTVVRWKVHMDDHTVVLWEEEGMEHAFRPVECVFCSDNGVVGGCGYCGVDPHIIENGVVKSRSLLKGRSSD